MLTLPFAALGSPKLKCTGYLLLAPIQKSSLEAMMMEKSPSLLKSESGPISVKKGDICLYFLEVGSEGT